MDCSFGLGGPWAGLVSPFPGPRVISLTGLSSGAGPSDLSPIRGDFNHMNQFRGYPCSSLVPEKGSSTPAYKPRIRPHSFKLYQTARYKKFRKWFLNRYPVCEKCNRSGSNEVHHIALLANDPSSLCKQSLCLALCKPCHSFFTRMEQQDLQEALASMYTTIILMREKQ